MLTLQISEQPQSSLTFSVKHTYNTHLYVYYKDLISVTQLPVFYASTTQMASSFRIFEASVRFYKTDALPDTKPSTSECARILCYHLVNASTPNQAHQSVKDTNYSASFYTKLAELSHVPGYHRMVTNPATRSHFLTLFVKTMLYHYTN